MSGLLRIVFKEETFSVCLKGRDESHPGALG